VSSNCRGRSRPRTAGKPVFRKFLMQLPKGFPVRNRSSGSPADKPKIIRLLGKERVCWFGRHQRFNESNLDLRSRISAAHNDFLYLRILGDYETSTIARVLSCTLQQTYLEETESRPLESWALKIERHLGEVRSVWVVSNPTRRFAPETRRCRTNDRIRSGPTLETKKFCPNNSAINWTSSRRQRRTDI